MLNGLDLFSGIGGLTKALEGYVIPVAYCEIEPYARGVLFSRQSRGEIPYAPVWDDVRTLKGSDFPSLDIIYGGFPCQDISTAGHGKGLAGKRSGLFFEIMRLAEEIKPAFIFLENVANIRSKGLDQVLVEIAGLGYDCRYGILSASDVGAPHRRDRWWLLAHRNDSNGSAESWKQQEERPKIVDPSGERELADPKSVGLQGGPAIRNEIEKENMRLLSSRQSKLNGTVNSEAWWAVEPSVGRVAHGIPKRVDRLRALGNAVVPQCAREAFERLMGLKP